MVEKSKLRLGKAALTPKGTYNAATTYEEKDVVEYNGASFITLKQIKGVTPVNDNVNYVLMTQAPQIDDATVGSETTWSSEKIDGTIRTGLEKTGNPVVFDHLSEGVKMNVVATVEPVQEGSGDPSPENVRPIVVPETLELRRTGKNLLDYELWKTKPIHNGTAVFENNGITLTATKYDCYTSSTVRIPVVPGDTITISWEADSDANGRIYVFPNGSQTGMAAVDNANAKKISFKCGEGITSISFRFGATQSGTTISYKNIMINYGPTPLPYEPYRGDTYTMDLPEGFGGGSVSNDGISSMVLRKVTLDGNVKITDIGNMRCMVEVPDIAPILIGGDVIDDGVMCNILSPSSNDGTFNAKKNYIFHRRTNGKAEIVVRLDHTFVTANDYKQWFETNRPEIVYPVIAAKNNVIPPVVIPALSGTNTITSNAQSLTVTAESVQDQIDTLKIETKNTSDVLIDGFDASGNPVMLEHRMPVGYPLDVVAHIEPYQEGEGDPSPTNVRPIVVPSELSLQRCGKNLLKLDDLPEKTQYGLTFSVINGVVKIAGTPISSRNEVLSKISIDLPEETTVTLSINVDKINSYIIYFYGDDLKPIGNLFLNSSNRTATGTFPKGAKSIGFYSWKDKPIDAEFSLQIELGSTASPFEPYRGDTYKMDLPEGFAGGDVHTDGNVDGTWAVFACEGKENEVGTINVLENTIRINLNNNILPKIPKTGANSICSHFIKIFSNAEDSASHYANGAIIFKVPKALLETYDKAGVSAYLKAQHDNGTPVTIAYEISTPTTTTIPPQVIPALDGTNTITSNAQSLDVHIPTVAEQFSKLTSRIATLESAATNI